MAFPLGFGPFWGTPFPPPSTGPEVHTISGCRGDILSQGTHKFFEAAYCNHCGGGGHHSYEKIVEDSEI